MAMIKFFSPEPGLGNSSSKITSDLVYLTNDFQIAGGQPTIAFEGESGRDYIFTIRNISINVEAGAATIVGGRLSAFTLVLDGLTTFSVTDLNLPAATFISAALANDQNTLRELLFQGADRMTGTVNDDFLFGYAGDDTLKGSGGVDTIWGDAGNDHLFGGNGADMLAGDSASGALGDTRDQLFGGDGADRLVSNFGRDTLTGGAGADTFVYYDYGSARTSHRITDFNADVDKIGLYGSTFQALGPDGVIDAELFRRGTSATEADDRLIYDRATGRLYFDADGVGGVAKFLLYVIEANPDLRANDIVLGSPF